MLSSPLYSLRWEIGEVSIPYSFRTRQCVKFGRDNFMVGLGRKLSSIVNEVGL